MIKVKYIFLMTALVFIFPAFLFAAEINEEEITPKNTQKIYIDEVDYYSFLQRGKLNNLLAVSLGYDNNSHLDSTRDGDGFAQNYFKSSFTSPITHDKKVNAILEYDLMSLFYMGESTLDIIKNGFHAGIENKINKEWEVSAGYRLDDYAYINSGSDSFFDDTLYFKVKENLPHKIYQQFGYSMCLKNYPSRHTRASATQDSDKKRYDMRNTLEYEAGKYFAKDLYKFNYEYYNNDSDEGYLQYYDYESHKASASLTHLFNDKVFGFLSFAWQYRPYRKRTITLDPLVIESDKTFFIASALYYNINKSLTVGLSYTYRQNVSNDPIENYSGSLISVSTYYRF